MVLIKEAIVIILEEVVVLIKEAIVIILEEVVVPIKKVIVAHPIKAVILHTMIAKETTSQ